MAGAPRKASKTDAANTTTADLVAVLVAVTDGEPKIMTIANAGALPSGPFEFAHRSLQTGLRAWVEAQTGHPLGYVEQLYTFADRGRGGDAKSPHSISISYLGLTREDQVGQGFEAHWSGWYDYFPWEDQRSGLPATLAKTLASRLRAWSKSADSAGLQRERWQRVAITFGLDEREWNEELVLQRYELLYEAGLIPEAVRDGAERHCRHPWPADDRRSPPHSRDRDRAAARQDQIPPGGVRTDAGGIHPAATATQC